MTKNISLDDIKVGMPIRIIRTKTGGEGEALRSTVATYEGVVLELDAGYVSLSNPGFNADYLKDGKPVRVAIANLAANVSDAIEFLTYPVDTIVRAKTDSLGLPDYEPLEVTHLWLRNGYGWFAIGSDVGGYLARNDLDIESGQARFEILEVIHTPTNGASA